MPRLGADPLGQTAASSAVSSSEIPLIGTRGQTSVAPIRGCSPRVAPHVDQLRSATMTRKAASTTRPVAPAKVTHRPVGGVAGIDVEEGHAGTRLDLAVSARMTSGSRPSLKLGTHSIRGFIGTVFGGWGRGKHRQETISGQGSAIGWAGPRPGVATGWAGSPCGSCGVSVQ